MPENETYAFGPYRLLLSERKLLLDGEPVELGSRAFDTLALLVQERGKVVSKHQILEYVWSDLTVDEANLRFQMSSLRRTLSGDAKDDIYIKNIPGRGYVFIASVESAAYSPPPDTRIEHGRLELPNRPQYFVGREQSLASLVGEISFSRFVSVVGFGGIGKTTLVNEFVHRIAHQFSNDVCYVDLGSIKSPDLVLPTISIRLGYAVQTTELMVGLVRFLSDRRVLLVLDCCEHVIEAASELASELFRHAPQCHIIATSREPLRAEGEVVHLLEALELPAEKSDLTAAEALKTPTVQLLMQRARGSGYRAQLEDKDAGIVAAICRQLDGNPLAIELAGSRVVTYGFSDLLLNLGGRAILNWPGRRHDIRHKTLEATLDWSYELLSADDRRILGHLSVFVGAFSIEAAQAVSGSVIGDRWAVSRAIEELADRSLIAIRPDKGGNLYRLLDVTRVYAEVKLLESGERDSVMRYHAEYYLDLVPRLNFQSVSAEKEDALLKADSLAVNVRAALEWCFAVGGDTKLGIELATVAAKLFLDLSMLRECLHWCQIAVSKIESKDHCLSQTLVLQQSIAMSMMYTLGNVDQVGGAIDRGLELAVELENREAELHLLAGQNLYLTRRSDYLGALRAAHRFAALAHASQNSTQIIASDWMLGSTYNLIGQQRLGLQLLEQGAERAGTLGIGRVFYFGFNHAQRASIGRAWTSWLCGAPDKAQRHVEQVLATSAAENHPVSLCISYLYSTHVVLWLRELDWADDLIASLISVATRNHMKPYLTGAKALRGELLAARGQFDEAVSILQDVIEPLRVEQLNIMLTPSYRTLAESLAWLGRFDEAEAIVSRLIEHAEISSPTYLLPEILRTHAEIKRMSGVDRSDIEPFYLKAITRAQHDGALSWELRAVNSVSRLWIESGELDRARGLLQSTLGMFTEGFDTGDLREAHQLLEQSVKKSVL